MRRNDALRAQLREKRRRTGIVRQRLESPKRVFRPQRQHGAERVGIDSDTAKLAQEMLERVSVGQPHSMWR